MSMSMSPNSVNSTLSLFLSLTLSRAKAAAAAAVELLLLLLIEVLFVLPLVADEDDVCLDECFELLLLPLLTELAVAEDFFAASAL